MASAAGCRPGPFRVLLVHNWHRSDQPSGENQAVQGDLDALAAAGGVHVEIYSRSNDEVVRASPLRRLAVAGRPIVSPADNARLRAVIRSFRPHIVHLHNPYPLLSPSVVGVAKSEGVPVVQTVHNYRHVCAAGTLFRDGHPCTDCVGRVLPWPAVVHRCYRGSAAASVPLATAIALHRPTWSKVDRYVAVSAAVADHLVATGIAPERVTIRPNHVPDPGFRRQSGSGAVYVGRLAAEKGITLLLDAWRRGRFGERHRLVIVGDGPIRPQVDRAAQRNEGVVAVGAVSHEEAMRRMAEAAVVVVPSLWEEPFGLTAVEALASGRPVVATKVGALSTIIDEHVGWSVPPTAEEVALALAGAFEQSLEGLGRAARARYETRYAALPLGQALVQVYADVVESPGGERRRSDIRGMPKHAGHNAAPGPHAAEEVAQDEQLRGGEPEDPLGMPNGEGRGR